MPVLQALRRLYYVGHPHKVSGQSGPLESALHCAARPPQHGILGNHETQLGAMAQPLGVYGAWGGAAAPDGSRDVSSRQWCGTHAATGCMIHSRETDGTRGEEVGEGTKRTTTRAQPGSSRFQVVS